MVAGSWASSVATRRTMQGNRGRDTKPECALRSAVHRLGLRYRVSRRPLPELRRTADLLFSSARVAVYLDGCFWHGCPDHYVAPATNATFWATKLSGNRERDADTDRRLLEAGWLAVRIWEHEDPQVAARRISAIVHDRTSHSRLSQVPSTTCPHRTPEWKP